MAPNFGTERASLLTALNGGVPDPSGYDATVALQRARTGSANHKMWSNPTRALVGLNTKKFEKTDAVLSWCEWYVEQALHENECLTPNPSYRGAIETGTLALAGCALVRGRAALLDRLLKRSRAGIGWILLGVGSGAARRVRNHHMDKIGQSVLLVGDGERGGGVTGLPYFAQPGKRGRVREGPSGSHTGPFEDTENLGLGILVAQALGGYPYPKGWADLFTAIRQRWPSLPPFGLSEEDRTVARAWIRNPTDETLARQIVGWVNEAPMPDHPLNIDRYADGAVAFWLEEVDDSSTGADVVDVLMADGTHYLGSVDTGSRDSTKGGAEDVSPQIVLETEGSLICKWKSGAREEIIVPKPRGQRAFRIHSPGFGGRAAIVQAGGVIAPEPPAGPAVPVTPPAPVAPPKKKRRCRICDKIRKLFGGR